MTKQINNARIGILLAAAGTFMASAAVAAPDCENAEDQATLNECADLYYKAADAELNKTYKAITARLGILPDTKAALVKAQRAWIAFLDAECAFEASAVLEGSAYPMTLSNCLAGVTQERVSALDVFLNCDETDLSCPVPSE